MRNLGQVSRRCDFGDGMRIPYLSGKAVCCSEIFSAGPKVKIDVVRGGSLTVSSQYCNVTRASKPRWRKNDLDWSHLPAAPIGRLRASLSLDPYLFPKTALPALLSALLFRKFSRNYDEYHQTSHQIPAEFNLFEWLVLAIFILCLFFLVWHDWHER